MKRPFKLVREGTNNRLIPLYRLRSWASKDNAKTFVSKLQTKDTIRIVDTRKTKVRR